MAAPIDISAYMEKFDEFLEDYYNKELALFKAAYPAEKSFYISWNKLERYDHELADELIDKPDIVLAAAKESLIRVVGSEIKMFDPHVRILDMPESDILIQDVGAAHIQKLVHLQGVVTKRAEVRPKVRIGIYKCIRCDAVYKVPIEKGTEAPEICEQCRKRTLELDEASSYFVNLQRIEVQELLERVRGGTPAGHIEAILEDDLVNTVVPGDTVDIVGIVRIRPVPKVKTPIFMKYIDTVSITNIQREFEEVELTKEDIKEIHEFSKRKDVFEQLTRAIAPSIYGHKEVKEALVLQLFGGTAGKTLPEGGKIRSDIHILLIGDPGSAKTRLLQYVAELAPKSVYVSGKSVTGAGLTAAAEKDEMGEGGWTLKAGALVLASGGIASVDEFDKIDVEEQAALHEVMESQTISIAKAGIVAKFKAKTAILAAANPKFGRFDPNQLPVDQFDIPATLMSRFDLIFPIKDVLDEEKDKKLVHHILTSHRDAAMKKTPEAEEYDVVSTDFLRKYIAYARKNVNPILTPEASEKIKEFYLDLRRMGQGQKSVAITPRQIEGLIRLSEASAKARLSSYVEITDAERAVRLTQFVLSQLAFDRSTGRIDADILWSGTGQPRSRAEQYYDLIGIIRDLTASTGQTTREEIIQQAKKLNIDEVTARRMLEEMQRKGEIFEPKPGFFRLVQRSD
ncbi:MAG: minichromosome maintenance protein MCM [Candidatus Micrarchaeia archaeon]